MTPPEDTQTDAPVAGRIGPDERHVWRPRRRALRHQRTKIAGGVVLVGVFAGWMAVQWSNRFIRLFAAIFMALTVWVVARSVIADLARLRRRQASIQNGVLYVTTPDRQWVIPFDQVGLALWRDELDVSNGLWLYDRQQRPMVHLNTQFLTDQAEARQFMAWAGSKAALNFEVKWPRSSRL